MKDEKRSLKEPKESADVETVRLLSYFSVKNDDKRTVKLPKANVEIVIV